MWPTRNGEINCGKQGYCGKYRATINFPVSDESFVRFGPFSDSQIMNMCCDSWDMLDPCFPANQWHRFYWRRRRRSGVLVWGGVEADNRVLPPRPIPNVCPLCLFVCSTPPPGFFQLADSLHYYPQIFPTFLAIFRCSFLAPRKSILAS